jgi:carboxylesterase type B
MADHSISGDSDHMVLWGQSAGGNAANSYGYANPEDPIVAGIVAQSGTTRQINSANTTAFTILAKKFGCDGLDAEEELTCMQGVDNDSLHHVIRNGTNVPSFSPVADGVTLFANNTARLEDGQVAKVVCLIGSSISPRRSTIISNASLASDPWQHGQRRRRFCFAGRSSSQERHFPVPPACGLWRRG